MQQVFKILQSGCKKIKTFPNYNTENVTSLYQVCHSCSELENVPLLNTSKATSLSRAFAYCPNLTDESLNNILQMCINSAQTSNKTLVYLGILSGDYPASRIQALSNYQAFIDAGWTIGY